MLCQKSQQPKFVDRFLSLKTQKKETPELSLSQPPANQPSETGVVGQIQC